MDEFVLPKLLLARLLVIILAILLLIGWSLQKAITWKRTPLDWPLIAFIGSAALSSVFGLNQVVAVFGTYDRWEGLLTIVMYGLLFWFAVQFTSHESDARALTWCLLIGGYIIGAVAILQSAFGLLGGGYFQVAGGIRADATLANPDFLGIFLAMLLPVAFAKVVSQRPLLTRVLAANVVVVLSLALVFTYTRAAWIGAITGVACVLALRRGRFNAWPVIGFAVLLAGVIAILGATSLNGSVKNPAGIPGAVYARILSIGDLRTGTAGDRVKTWQDTLRLIESRPVFGYGPDTFGLVYPAYQTSDKAGALWDKPHEELLGVAATQGLVGALAYLWILASFVRAFWAGRIRRGAVGLFGAWVGYEIATQLNFSYLPTAIPFWLFAAAAIVTWAPHTQVVQLAQFPRRVAWPVLAGTSLGFTSLAISAIVLPYMADADYYSAQAAPDLVQARALIAQARQLAPFEATYATQAGNFALNLDSSGNPGTNADWAGALDAYGEAAKLGSYAPETFRHLAITDEHLGHHDSAVVAARRAVELDRFDPVSQALLAGLLNH